MNYDIALNQPWPLRLTMWSNILLWGIGIPLPGALLGVNIAITLVAAIFARPRLTLGLGMRGLLVGVVVYGVFSFAIGPCEEYGFRVGATAVVALINIWALSRLASTMNLAIPILSLRDARYILLTITCSAAFQFTYRLLIEGVDPTLRVGGLLLEPSHLALSCGPLFFYLWNQGRRQDVPVVLGCFVVLMLVSSSSTLLIFSALIFIVDLLLNILSSLRKKLIATIIIIGLLAGFVLFAPQEFKDATMERFLGVVFFTESSNISSVVYVNGWQLLEAYLKSSHGLGLGLNAMGCQPRAFTVAMGYLARFELEYLNFNDGSFLLSKLGSEFGYVGIFLWMLSGYMMLWLNRSRNLQCADATRIFGYATFAVIAIGGVIRSTGYFAGPVQLALLVGLSALAKTTIKNAGSPHHNRNRIISRSRRMTQ